MKIVYYYDEISKSCPVKSYLAQLTGQYSDKKQANKKLADIHGKIIYIAQINGRPQPPVARPIQNFSFFEIKSRKNNKILIRITYFCHQGTMILLDAFEKPDYYRTSKDKKTVSNEFKKSELYRNNFIMNPKLYEEYK